MEPYKTETNGTHYAFPTTKEALNIPLTKREYFAAMAMQGLLAAEQPKWRNSGGMSTVEIGAYADGAVEIADALIEALNK